MSEDNNGEQEIMKQYEKWKKWKLEVKNKHNHKNQIEEKISIGKPEDNAYNYAKKLIQKLQQSNNQQQCPISKNIADQLQTNSCVICLELMVPPYIPMILFPCGHNVCRMSLLEHADKNLPKHSLKIATCPLCRARISNYTQNRNLMKLICTYVNKKQLLQKELENQAKQKQQTNTIIKLTQHCNLLQNQKKVLDDRLKQFKKNKKVMEEVIERLLDERKICRKKFDNFEEESRLINKHLNEKQQQLQKVQTKIATLQEKQRIIVETIQPLRLQKQKLEIQEANRIINKG